VKDKVTFTFLLQPNSKRLIKVMQLLLIAVNAFFLCYLILTATLISNVFHLTAPFLLFTFISISWRQNKKVTIDTKSKLLLLLGFSFATNWLANFYWLPGIGMIGASYLFVQAISPITIQFSPTTIKFNTFPARTYSWEKLDQVILRDNILTLNFCNNRFIQQSVVLPANFNTDQFNEFCLSRFEPTNQV